MDLRKKDMYTLTVATIVSIVSYYSLSSILHSHYNIEDKPEIADILQKRNVKTDNVVTVYYQGMNSPQSQASYYAGKDGVVDENNILIKTIKAPLLAYNIFIGKEIPQVIKGEPNTFFEKTQQLIYSQLLKYRGTNAPLYSVDMSKTDIGQKIDINDFYNRLVSAKFKYNESNIILWGVSRGSATIFSSVCLMNKNNDDFSKVKLIVLEGIYDDLINCLKLRSWYPEQYFVGLLTQHDFDKEDEYSPISLAEYFPKEIPIAIIYTDNDKSVPNTCTLNLINKLKELGHEKLHILNLHKSGHSAMSLDNDEDRIAYKTFIEDLYDMYL
jgi:hypothetical protein